ncbi:MAG: DUF998 domain-containing protein [Halobacteriaceae archaeon]
MSQRSENDQDGEQSNIVFLRTLSLAGVLGPVIFWIVIGILGILTPEYSAVTDVISDLGAVTAPFALIQRINFIILGLGILAFAIGLDRQFRESWRPWIGVILIGMFGVIGVMGAGIFQSNPTNPDSLTHMLHSIVSVIGFLAGLIGIPLTSWRLYKENQWSGYQSRLIVIAITTIVIGSFGIFLASNGTSWPGLGQRLFVGVLTGWIAYHSFSLYKLARIRIQSV